ncbi:MAG: DUF1850 domain-containing protein [Spirochaetaceae bacterium]|jgi:hypothetical protein|nr:DUF1850 domain-containing protein [Spirochaetaceae bacterium]
MHYQKFPLKWWYGLAFNLSLVALTLAVMLVIQRSPVELVIIDAATGRLYGRWSVKNGSEFAVEFVHSVNQSPVKDTFMVSGTTIRPVSTRFKSFGAGMQTELEPGQRLTRDGDAMVITGFTQSFRKLRYIVGTVSDHSLFINGAEISLRDLCGKNAHLVIRLYRTVLGLSPASLLHEVQAAHALALQGTMPF